MVILTMHVCSGAKHIGILPLHSRFKTWMIWGVRSDDRKQGIVYPSNERIVALAEGHFPRLCHLQILERSETHQGIAVRLPTGIKPIFRDRFLRAMGEESDLKA